MTRDVTWVIRFRNLPRVTLPLPVSEHDSVGITNARPRIPCSVKSRHIRLAVLTLRQSTLAKN
jgi:hypothetical protein